MKYVLIFILLSSTGMAQRLELKVNAYDAALFVGMGELNVHFDSQGHAQGRVIIWEYNDKANDSVFLFKGSAMNNYLVDTVYWYNTRGELMRKAHFVYLGHTPPGSECYPVSVGVFCLGGNIEGEDIAWAKDYRTGKWYKKSVTNYLQGKQNGWQYEYYSNRKLKEKTYWEDGMKKGAYESFHEEGFMQKRGQYAASMPIGEWTSYGEKGLIYRKEWYSGRHFLPDSSHKYFENTGKIEERSITILPQMQSHRYMYREDGSLYKYQFYKNTGQDSVEITWYASGKKQGIGHFVNNKKEGAFTTWYENGKKEKEEFYASGKKHGRYTKWYDNGAIKEEGMYEQDKATGVWKQYWPNGKPVKTGEWIPQENEVIAVDPAPEEAVEEQLVWTYVYELPQMHPAVAIRTLQKKDELQFLKKYKTVRINGRLDRLGKIVYTVLTPMKKQEVEKLMDFLQKEYSNWSAFNIGGKKASCSMEMVLEWKKIK